MIVAIFFVCTYSCKNSNGVLWHANDSAIPKELNKIIIIILVFFFKDREIQSLPC